MVENLTFCSNVGYTGSVECLPNFNSVVTAEILRYTHGMPHIYHVVLKHTFNRIEPFAVVSAEIDPDKVRYFLENNGVTPELIKVMPYAPEIAFIINQYIEQCLHARNV